MVFWAREAFSRAMDVDASTVSVITYVEYKYFKDNLRHLFSDSDFARLKQVFEEHDVCTEDCIPITGVGGVGSWCSASGGMFPACLLTAMMLFRRRLRRRHQQ